MDNDKGLLPSAISKAIKLPMVKVNRRAFLSKTFSDSQGEELSRIIDYGPQTIFDVSHLKVVAKHTVLRDTEKSSAASFVAGLPSNPIVMAGTGTADVMQYFAFALRMAQEIAYIFGQKDLFDDNGSLSEDGERDIILYLGAMLGVSAANSGIIFATKGLGKTAGKQVTNKALTKTAWYPILKKIAAAIDVKITKQGLSKTITKAVPVVGGVVSGGLTFLSFRPMGNRLVKTFSEASSSNEKAIKKAQDVIIQGV